MSGEVKIRERVSEYRCYVLDSVAEEDLRRLEKWVETETRRWRKVRLTTESKGFKQLLFVESESQGDYSDKSEWTVSEFPLYVVVGYGLSLYAKKEFDEDFEIIHKGEQQ